jgi:elongation factor G
MSKCRAYIVGTYYEVDVSVPEEYTGDGIGEINIRRGRVEGMEARSGVK